MTAMPTELRPHLQQWWTTVEPGTQAIFEAIYMEAPQAVSRALSGGAWEADGPEPGLAAQLGTTDQEFNLYDAVPRLEAVELPVATPFHAQVGQPVTISWVEINRSKTDLGAYVSDIYVADANNDQVGAARLDGAGVPAGGSAERSWEFPGAATEGPHTVTVWVNAEGADAGSGVPGDQGFRSSIWMQFGVGGGETAANEQDFELWAKSLESFQRASGESADGAAALLQEGINWLSALPSLSEEERSTVEQVARHAEYLTGRPDIVDQDAVRAKLNELATVCAQTGFPDDAGRARVVAALDAVRTARS